MAEETNAAASNPQSPGAGVPESALRPKQTIILLCLFIAALLVVWLVLSVLGNNAMTSAIGEWEAAGGKTQLAELEPTKVNADENAASIYIAAYTHLNVFGPREWAVLESPWRIDNPELLALLLERAQPALALTHRAAEMDEAVWPIDYADLDATAASAAKALSPTRQLAVLLGAEAYARAQAGNAQGAAESIRAGLRMTEHVCRNPLLVNFLVAVSETQPTGGPGSPAGIEETMITALMMSFRDRPLPENHGIDDALSRLDYRQTYVESLRAEGTLGVANFTAEDALPRAAESLALSGEDVPWWYVSGVARMDQGRYLDALRSSIDRLSKPFYEQLRMPEAQQPADWALLTRSVMPANDVEMNVRVAAAEGRRQLGIAAVRLRMYNDKMGQYPNSITAIIPVPIDPFTGRPINYMKTADGFIIGTSGYATAQALTWDWSFPLTQGDASASQPEAATDGSNAEPAAEAESEAEAPEASEALESSDAPEAAPASAD